MNQSKKKCIKVLKTLLLFNRVHIFHWMYIFIKQIHIYVKRHIYPFFKYIEFSGTKPCKYVVEYPNNYKAANFGLLVLLHVVIIYTQVQSNSHFHSRVII